jgi:hypothetical protein
MTAARRFSVSVTGADGGRPNQRSYSRPIGGQQCHTPKP